MSSHRALRDLKRLVDAAVPPAPDAVFEQYGWSPPPEGESVHNAYRWRSGNQTFNLTVSAYRIDGRWVGLFDLRRCPAVDALELWDLDDGLVVRVLQAEVRENASMGRHTSPTVRHFV
jgi:hypothetical protein